MALLLKSVSIPKIQPSSKEVTKINEIAFKKSTKCSRKVRFDLIPEKTLPFAENFKEFEEEIHHGADQDVDSDEEDV